MASAASAVSPLQIVSSTASRSTRPAGRDCRPCGRAPAVGPVDSFREYGDGPWFATGEEKTINALPYRYGIKIMEPRGPVVAMEGDVAEPFHYELTAPSVTGENQRSPQPSPERRRNAVSETFISRATSRIQRTGS